MFKVKIALALTLLFWGSAFVGIRVGLEDYSPGALALLRFLVASAVMTVSYARLKGPTMPWRIRLQIALIGVEAIGIYNLCLNIGELTVSAGTASFVIGLIPVLTIMLAMFFLREVLNGYVWVGIGFSFVGLLCMLFGDENTVMLDKGVIAIFIAAVMGAIYSLVQKPFLKNFHPIAVTAWVMWGGTAMLLVFAPALIREFPLAHYKTTLSVVYLGIFPGALAYALWTYVLSHYTASKAAIYLYGMPIISTILGIFLLHEFPTMLGLVGGILSLLGAVIATRFLHYKKRSVDFSAKFR